MSQPEGTPKQNQAVPNGLLDRLRPLVGSERPGLLVIRSPHHAAGSTILNCIIQDRPGPGVTLAAPQESLTDAYNPSAQTRPELWVKVLSANDEVASIAAASAVVRVISSIVLQTKIQPTVLPLWLPPPVLQVYSSQPNGSVPTIALDGWDDILAFRQGAHHPSATPAPTEDVFEQNLLRSFEESPGVHFIVVTRRIWPELESKAALVLDVTPPMGDPSGATTVRLLGESAPIWTFRPPLCAPMIFWSRTSVACECPCGTRIPTHGAVFGITPLPISARGLFRGLVFCSTGCIRRFLFEALEMVETLESPGSASVVADLAELHRELAETLAAVLGDQGTRSDDLRRSRSADPPSFPGSLRAGRGLRYSAPCWRDGSDRGGFPGAVRGLAVRGQP